MLKPTVDYMVLIKQSKGKYKGHDSQGSKFIHFYAIA